MSLSQAKFAIFVSGFIMELGRKIYFQY